MEMKEDGGQTQEVCVLIKICIWESDKSHARAPSVCAQG